MTNKTLMGILGWTAASTVAKTGLRILVFKLMAVRFGPEGLGQSGNIFMLISVLDMLSGAGIFNGVNKYVSQFRNDPKQLQKLLGTASTIVFFVSCLMAVILFLFAKNINRLICLPADCLWIIQIAGVVQFAIAEANLFRAILKGEGDAVGNSLSLIGGSILGLLAYWIAIQYYGYQGALFGMVLMYGWSLVPAIIVFNQKALLPWHWLKLTWNSRTAFSLFNFSLMAFLSTGLVNFTYMLLRNWLREYGGWAEVGMWQGIYKFSDICHCVTTAFLSVYLLPRLSHLQERQAISRMVIQTLGFILPIALLVNGITWILRKPLTLWLFSDAFMAMDNLYVWQLSGNVFKIASGVFASLILSKALLKFHLLSECLIMLSTLLFSFLLIPSRGATGAAQAYLITNVLYFIASLSVGLYYYKQRSFTKIQKTPLISWLVRLRQRLSGI